MPIFGLSFIYLALVVIVPGQCSSFYFSRWGNLKWSLQTFSLKPGMTVGTDFHSFLSWYVTVKFLNFLDARKHCCNIPKIRTKSPNLRVVHQKDANEIANCEDPDQTAPLDAV